VHVPRPYLGHGVGLRRRHYGRALRGELDVDWVEAISENFFGEGGRPLAVLERLRRDMPVVLHGVSLGIGSPDPPTSEHLRRLRRLADRVEPAWISDHLCWGHLGGVYSHELLPLPLTEAALDRVVRRVQHVQDVLGRRILLENTSTYLTFERDAIPEWEFLAEVARRGDCRILLDLNNILVSAHNHGFDPARYLAGIPGERVWQFHLARHSDRGAYRFDDHSGAVLPEVWSLYEEALRRYGPVSSLVEWDEDVPPWPELRAEQREASRRAAAILGELEPDPKSARRPRPAELSRDDAVGSAERPSTGESSPGSTELAASPEDPLRSAAQRSLSGVQRELWRAITTPGGSEAVARQDPALDRSLSQSIRESAGFTRQERVDVYALSTTWRLRGALAEIYPTLLWLLGDAAFDELAARVIRDAPSTDPDLGRFGAGLPDVLAQTARADDDPWLVDLAQSEQIMGDLLDAADPLEGPLTPTALEGHPPEAWPSLRLRPIPALRILGGIDLGPLWACRDQGEPAAAGWTAGRACKGVDRGTLLWRQGFEVLRRTMTPVETVILRALRAGTPLASALDAGIAHSPQLTPEVIVGALRRWLEEGLFAGISTG